MTNNLQLYYNDVLENGEKQFPRGLETTSLTNQFFSFSPGEIYTRPHGNMTIGLVELLQFISGTFSIEPFKVIAPGARLDLFTAQSAYGPRVKDQLPRVIEELGKDLDSRRAVMMIAHPTDTPETMPCTLSAQFQIQTIEDVKYLISTWTMRSSDLIWGLPTDMIQFGGITQMIANCLRVTARECVVNAGNVHVYKETRMKPGEQFSLLTTFTIPDFYTLDLYKHWADVALDAITRELITTKQVFGL